MLVFVVAALAAVAAPLDPVPAEALAAGRATREQQLSATMRKPAKEQNDTNRVDLRPTGPPSCRSRSRCSLAI
jgi:hypothetical protein